MFRSVLLSLAVFFAGTSALVEAQSLPQPNAAVPFVGCEADGQVGPLSAPTGESMAVAIPEDVAQKLAYYKSEQGLGVLAPRGWYCFGVYGSSGYALYVSPQRIKVTDLFSATWSGFAGPAVELVGEDGDTSGRFGVAHTIAHVFPAHKAFVEKVIKEGIDPSSSFAFGPYPKDKLFYRSKEMVEYQTPADTDGLGTSFRLRKNARPINGVSILLGETPDLLQLSVRLPANLSGLTALIIQKIETVATHTADNP